MPVCSFRCVVIVIQSVRHKFKMYHILPFEQLGKEAVFDLNVVLTAL